MCEGDLVDIHDFPETLVSPTHQVKVEDDASVGAPRPVESGTAEPIKALDAQSKRGSVQMVIPGDREYTAVGSPLFGDLR
jgi:hypothetical protein